MELNNISPKEIEETQKNIKPYLDEILNPSLIEKKFSEEQIIEINKSIVYANIKHHEKQSVLKENESSNTLTPTQDTIQEGILHLFENPHKIIRMFRPDKSWQPFLDFITSVIIIVAIVYLAAIDKLEVSQTATLFGGIIGYILGSSRH